MEAVWAFYQRYLGLISECELPIKTNQTGLLLTAAFLHVDT